METATTSETSETGEERKKIKAMVAIDDSKESFYALTWTLDKIFTQSTISPPPGRVEESKLVALVHVMEPLPHYAYPGGYVISDKCLVVESATEAQEENAVEILSRASKVCNERKVAAEKVLVEGDPKQMICETAEKMGVEVLVVGSRGLGQIKRARALLGSVSDYCAHHATCPVVIVKLPK